MKWGHTDTARLIVCAPTWERGGGRQLPRSGITVLYLEKVYRTIKISKKRVVANFWRGLATITLIGG